MRVEANMSNDDDAVLSIAGWYAKTADYAIASIRRQLDLAATVWPSLASYRLIDVSKIKDPGEGPLIPG